MSKSGYTARLAAAAFAVGIALGAPAAGVAPVAAADSPDTSAASDSGGRAEPGRAVRGPRAASRADSNTRGATARAAAAEPAAADDEAGPRHGVGARTVEKRGRSSAGAEPPAAVATPGGTAPEKPDIGTPAPDTPAPDTPLQAGPLSARAPVAQPPSAPVAAVAVNEPAGPLMQQADLPPAAPVAQAPAYSAPATLDAPAGMATSSAAATLDGLLGSFRALFEGAALLWRRRFFNEAPTVSPVQLTGLTAGPITGTIGAVDPEGDPLTYAVTGIPSYGTVTVGRDGAYTYTPGSAFAGSDSFVVAVTDGGMHINLLDLRRPKSVDAGVSVAQGITVPLLRFQFLYGSGSQYWSPEARRALESSAAKLAGYLVVSSPVTITYTVTGQKFPLSSTLATAGSDFTFAGSGFIQTVVQKKIQTGVDANAGAPDGEITWNFGPSWSYGNTVANNQYDFQSTALHELVHTLGFLSYAENAGNNTGKIWTVYDSYLVDSGGTPVIGTDYRWKTAYNANLTGGNGGLYFGGPGAVAAYGGPVPLYTPSPYSSGSSLSHLDDGRFTGSKEKLMNAVSGQGTGVRVLSPVELGVLTDIGYQLTPSGAPTLMVVGFLFIRRPRRKNRAASRR